MKKSHKNLRAKKITMVLFSMSILIGVVAYSNNNSKTSSFSKLDTTAVEITYKAVSPIGEIGGTALPASCESSVKSWNDNGGYHLDGVNTDPGNCGTPTPSAIPAVCGSASGVDTSSTPNKDLCAVGDATPVAGNGPWSWECSGTPIAKCSANVQNNKNDPPATPIISGDVWAIINQTTSNQILSTDPENDDIYYELDWDGNGSVDGTTGSATSGVSVPIGHTYGAVGTYNVRGRAVQVNDTSKKSGWGTYTIRVAPSGGGCGAPANACGVTNGTVSGGRCISAGLPAGYGNSCSGPANACGMTDNTGTINCSGSCSVTIAPSNTLCPCTSGSNSCGMTNSGNLNAAGNICSASVPPNSACAVPPPPVPPGPAAVVINDFSASPKLLSINRTSKLYWDVSGNRSGCRITYTTTPGGVPSPSLNYSIPTNTGDLVTTPITEKRYYHLTCGAVEREAIVSPYSLTEI